MTKPSTHHEQQYDFRLAYLFGISLVSALGGLLFGYDLMVISGAKQFYEEVFQLTGDDTRSTVLQGWALSSCVIGCIIGALGVGKPCDRWGRIPVLKLAALLFQISAVWTSVAPRLLQFVLARLVGGIGRVDLIAASLVRQGLVAMHGVPHGAAGSGLHKELPNDVAGM